MEQSLRVEEQKLLLYIAYEDHLYAEQLSNFLSSLDSLYNYLYIAQVPELSLPLPLETRMRVDECHTGQSIEILLSEGIRQVFDTAGPFIQIMGSTGVIGAMAHLVFGYAKSFAEFRKTWYEGTQAKHEAIKARHEAERLKREIESEDLEKKLDHPQYDLSTVPIERKQQISEATAKFFNEIEYTPNIVRVRINGVTIVDKRPETQSLPNQKV